MSQHYVEKPRLRRFYLKRDEDDTGVSGVGIVAEGVEWTDGSVHIRWMTSISGKNIYDNIKSMMNIHGHEGKTKLIWIDQNGPEITDI